MRGTKLLLISIFVLTVVVGGVAIWVGLKLRQEEEPTVTITEKEEEEEEVAENILEDFEGLGDTLPLTGDGDVCWSVEGTLKSDCDVDIHATASYEAGDDDNYTNICLSIKNNGSNILKFNELQSYYCSTQGTSCIGPSDACTDNKDSKTYPSGEVIASGQTKEYCRQIPKYAECGMVQWDILASDQSREDMNIPESSCGFGEILSAWLVHLGTVCPMNCEDLTASPTSLTSDGGDVSLTTTVNDYYSALSSYDYDSDIGTVTGSGSSATWTIPSGTSEGTYNAWVEIQGGQISGSSISVADAGCTGSSASDCTDGSEDCRVFINIQDTPTAEPGFNAEKTANITCINDNTEARATYNIRVWNTSLVTGTIESVEDTYDSRFQSSWISGITPLADSHEDGTITWNNDGDGWELEAGEEITFSYTVTIPSSYLTSGGSEYEFQNVVVVTPEGGDEIEREAEVSITCTPGVPSTGIFDSTFKSIVFGLSLVLAGLGILKGQSILYKGLLVKSKREKFERKVLKNT